MVSSGLIFFFPAQLAAAQRDVQQQYRVATSAAVLADHQAQLDQAQMALRGAADQVHWIREGKSR
jgi:hypothetical protein